MKICSKCRQEKPTEEFSRDKNRKDGRCYQCKSCRSKSIKIWQRKNRKHHNKTVLTWQRNHKERWRGYEIKRKYGITLEQYAILLECQNGVCAICRKPETRTVRGKVTKLTIDHNHLTGRIRGLLCSKCNTALGSFHDDVELLTAAIRYLKEI